MTSKKKKAMKKLGSVEMNLKQNGLLFEIKNNPHC